MGSLTRRSFLSSIAVAGIGGAAMAGWMTSSVPAFAESRKRGGMLSEEDERFLAGQARAIVDSARLLPGQAKDKWRNLTPYTLHVPDGNMGYPAFWVRDAVMMLESDFIPLSELEGWIHLMSSVVRDRDWNVRPGVVVPAFAVPDHIDLDGKASFYPGSYFTDSRQGGYPYGRHPPLDDQFYYLFAVHHQWRKSGDTALFLSKIKAAFGEMRLSDLCERIYHVAPSDPDTALCIAGNVDTENAKDWGFCDTVFKSGKLLFPSILKLVAARQLAKLFSAAGLPEKAAAFRSDASNLQSAIPATFLRPSTSGKEAWLNSATGVGDQPDVWGSAYAVYSDTVDAPTARKLSRALVRAYREKTAVCEGCVRSLLSPSEWQKTISPLGAYQNGGYWGTPVGWYLAAMRKSDEGAAADMARDYIQFLRSHRRPDGLSQAWEWFNPATAMAKNPLYVATVALPYGCLRVSGLI